MYGMCVHLTLQCTHLKKERKKNTDFFFSLLVWLHSNGKVSSSLSFIWMSVCCKICKLTMLWADFIMYSLLLLFFFSQYYFSPIWLSIVFFSYSFRPFPLQKEEKKAFLSSWLLRLTFSNQALVCKIGFPSFAAI